MTTIYDNTSIGWHGPATTYGGPEYGQATIALRQLLDSFAAARPDISTINELTSTLEDWTSRLQNCEVDESEQIYGRRTDLIGRGQVTWPAINYTHGDDSSLEGRVRFGRFFLGRNGVAHGGAVAFTFDEVAGRLANLGGRPIARTAFLKTDYRAPVPIDVELDISAKLTRQEGRKRFLHLELRHGALLCAEAEVLMVALRPGQQ